MAPRHAERVPISMVVLSLVLRAPVNRVVNLVTAPLYAVTVAIADHRCGSCGMSTFSRRRLVASLWR